MKRADKYETAKAEITAIYHENKGRYGYRRITEELRNRKIHLNHKTVQRLMKQLGLVCRVRILWPVDNRGVLRVRIYFYGTLQTRTSRIFGLLQ